MEQAQTIRLNDGDCIHVFNTERPEQISLIRGPALIVVVKEEAATAMATSDDSQFDRSQMVLRSQI